MRQMVALKETDLDWSWPESQPRDNSATAMLNHLRFVSLGCRAKPRGDLFQACALLTVDRDTSIKAYAEALMSCLNEALEKRAVLYRPGTEQRSFDEDWLMRLAIALSKKDDLSAEFLLRSRVDHIHHRHIRFLVGRISEQYSLI